MSPAAGQLLINEIAPKLMGAVARSVRPVGSETFEELQQDAIAQAAAIVDSAERKGKAIPPGSVTWYVVQSLRSGRRFGYTGRTDAMCPAAALDGKVNMVSMDESLGTDDDDNEEITLHSALAAPGEDAASEAARHLDWQTVLPALDGRRKFILSATAAGQGPSEIAHRLGVSSPRACQLRESIGVFIQEAWRTNGIADAATPPAWRAGMRAASERRAARAERAW